MRLFISLFIPAVCEAARQVSVPMPIPGTDSDFIAPGIGEIRVYFIILSGVGTIATALLAAFLHRLFARLDRMEATLEKAMNLHATSQERFRHLPTRDEVMLLLKEEDGV